MLVLIRKRGRGVRGWDRMRGGARDIERVNAAVPKLTVFGTQLMLYEAEVESRDHVTDGQRDQQERPQNTEHQSKSL